MGVRCYKHPTGTFPNYSLLVPYFRYLAANSEPVLGLNMAISIAHEISLGALCVYFAAPDSSTSCWLWGISSNSIPFPEPHGQPWQLCRLLY